MCRCRIDTQGFSSNSPFEIMSRRREHTFMYQLYRNWPNFISLLYVVLEILLSLCGRDRQPLGVSAGLCQVTVKVEEVMPVTVKVKEEEVDVKTEKEDLDVKENDSMMVGSEEECDWWEEQSDEDTNDKIDRTPVSDTGNNHDISQDIYKCRFCGQDFCSWHRRPTTRRPT